MRIVAGKHRGRAIEAPEGLTVRPTADRARQAVFDVLMHHPKLPGLLPGARVLDAFAGTGAMGIEALSRGAVAAWFIDKDPRAIAALRANLMTLRELGRSTLYKSDALYPPAAPDKVNLAFLDPPYGQNLCSPALVALDESGWFEPGAVVVVEHDSAEKFSDHQAFEEFDRRHYGRAQFRFFLYRDAAPADPRPDEPPE